VASRPIFRSASLLTRIGSRITGKPESGANVRIADDPGSIQAEPFKSPILELIS
jgi:hypothetical protein